jgi:tRNA(fMet)-specific endonuclease VapC
LTRYMLDTNIISDLIRNPQAKAAARIARAGEDSVCTSVIVAAELRYALGLTSPPPCLRACVDGVIE